MCFRGTTMMTGTNEKIEYTPLPIQITGYDEDEIISLYAESAIGSFRYLALIDEDFKISKEDFTIIEDTTLTLDLPDISFLGLSFLLTNNMTCQVDHIQSATQREQFQFVYFPSIRVKYFLQSGVHSIFSIEIKREYFQKILKESPELFDAFAKGVEAETFVSIPVQSIYAGVEMLTIIAEVVAMIESKSPNRILLEGKARQLIGLCMERLKAEQVSVSIPLSQHEESAMRNACEYLFSNMENRPKISDAAALFGISERKLSQVFKARNGIGLHEHLVKERLKLAWSWLETGKSVKEVARILHYPSQQNFSHIFKKHFSVNAKDVYKNKNKNTGGSED